MQAWQRNFVLAGATCVLLALSAGCQRSGASLGKRLFDEGVGLDGRIAYTQGPDWLRFATAGCAVCHGARGQGLTVQASGVTGVAPAIDHTALEARGYDEASLRRALEEGVDPHGREFHYYMPRWKLSDAEFAALAAYLRQL
jgi:mono/diheme cytochrome c family protein